MAATYFLLLSCLGLIVAAQAQSCSKPAAEPNMDLKGDAILNNTFPDGAQVTFACNPGYQSAGGSAVITCTAGSWSPVRLKCERKNCGSAGEVANGIIDYPEGTLFGDECVIACNHGYRLVGNSKLRCQARGWDGRLPECEVVICDPPPTIAGGTFSPNKETYDYREVVRYTCQKDYTLNGSQSLSCSDTGTFVPGPPKCTKVQCEEPDVKNGEWHEGSRPPYGYMATVTYRCKSGYDIKGAGTLTCDINSQWSPVLPTCERTIIPTTKATTTTPSTTTTTTTTHSQSTKKPTAGPIDPAGNKGQNLGRTLGIVAVVLIVVLVVCGVLAFFYKRKRSRRGYPDKVDTKDGETVALS